MPHSAPQLKPGCLAEVVFDAASSVNVGRIVYVADRRSVDEALALCRRVFGAAPMHIPENHGGSLWEVHASSPLEWVLTMAYGPPIVRETTERIYHADCLRPIADPDSYTSDDHKHDLATDLADRFRQRHPALVDVWRRADVT